MENLVRIRLHGDLGKTIGSTWDLAVKSVREAVSAIEVLSKRSLYSYLIQKDKSGVRYKVLINENIVHYEKGGDDIESVCDSELLLEKPSLQTIDIIPVIEGAGDVLDVFTTILGVALIIAGIFTGGTLSAVLLTAGIGLTAAGVSSMLTKPPSFEPFQELESGRRPSYLFSGPQNTINEGGPVPVAYGEIIAGSQTIAANYKISYEASDSGNSLSNLKGDIDPDFEERTQSLGHNLSNINPLISFDFHPEDDEVIIPYQKAYSGRFGNENYRINEIHIVKFRDVARKLSTHSQLKTHFHPNGEAFGDTREGIVGSSRYKYRWPILHTPLGGNQTTTVMSIKTDRVGNRIFVGGLFKANNTNTQQVKNYTGGNADVENLICIESDGFVSNMVDHTASYFTHPQPNGTVSSIGVQADGKILIGGEFTTVTGVARSNFARLESNGTLNSFDPAPSQNIHAILVHEIEGVEYVFLGGNGGYLKKFNTSTGAEDTTFTGNLPSFGVNHIWALEIFNGLLIVGGNFTVIDNAINYECLCAVNKETGELVTGFNFDFTASTQSIIHLKPVNYNIGSSDITTNGLPRTIVNPSVRTLSANKNQTTLVVGGFFDAVNNEESITTKNIFAINPDGSLNKKFNSKPVSNEAGPDGHIQIAKFRKDLPTSDGKIYIGGSFTHYNSPAYTPEELDVVSQRTIFTPMDRTIYNLARLFGL